MTLAEYIEKNITDAHAALPLSSCRIIKERLIADAPALSHAVMLAVPFPHGPGKIASFARIRDYHGFFTPFADGIRELLSARYPSVEVRVFADHSPIDERDAACRAGLGVLGDNNLFISEKYGSFVFLGEIILSLNKEELEAEGVAVCDKEIGSCLHCGACAAACPSGAIRGDRSLCVSALTQKKGVLSDTESAMIKRGGSAWGCDVCAEVCPMNNVKTPKYASYFTENSVSPLCAEDIERMSDEEYAAYPFSWRKKEIIERNFRIICEGECIE